MLNNNLLVMMQHGVLLTVNLQLQTPSCLGRCSVHTDID